MVRDRNSGSSRAKIEEAAEEYFSLAIGDQAEKWRLLFFLFLLSIFLSSARSEFTQGARLLTRAVLYRSLALETKISADISKAFG